VTCDVKTVSEPNSPGGPSGLFALGVVAAGLLLGWCILPGPPHFRPPEIHLIELCCWGIGMTVGLGLSIASIRRGPARGRAAAFLAFTISLLCICGVVVQLCRVSLRS
jgi:hypothetical protein